jgi:acyl-CoA synthetase (AMP-forming)/AMP-acid ligase II
MPHKAARSIREQLRGADSSSGCLSKRFLSSATESVVLAELLGGSTLGGRRDELTGRSILLATREQFAAATALIEMDGLAARIIICPPDITPEQFPSLIERGGVDVIVSDYEVPDYGLLRIRCGYPLTAALTAPSQTRATEWVLLTSGTTSEPKMIAHNLASLTAPIGASTKPDVWATFYDIRRYGGMQIFLRGVFGHGSLVLSSADEVLADYLVRLGGHGVTHLSGTPSHWRRVLMSPHAGRIAPQNVRLSGEIPDQAILNALHSFYPNAAISHAFASTEAGVAFEVKDGMAGFPAAFLGCQGDVEMKVSNDSLHIRSNRIAARYLSGGDLVLADGEGFVDTGDMVELRGDRYYFLGRRNGVINVGGFKVYPEEVEAVINRHPGVHMSMVRSRRNPITGSLVSADVMLKESCSLAETKVEILELCRQNLAPHKIPATLRCVPSLDVAPGGKLARRYA